MRLTSLALIGFVTLFSVGAQAQQSRVRGTVERLDGQALTIKTAEGTVVTVALAPNYSVGAVVKASMADIRKGGFIGVGARPQAGGGLQAVQVFIFPEAMRGTGEGHKPWGVLPDSTMTNATVAETVSQVEGSSVTLTYPGGEQKIAVPPEANIIMAAPAEAADLVVGAQVALTATRQSDGSMASTRVTIAKAGAQLPL